jgi:hypothetical protein
MVVEPIKLSNGRSRFRQWTQIFFRYSNRGPIEPPIAEGGQAATKSKHHKPVEPRTILHSPRMAQMAAGIPALIRDICTAIPENAVFSSAFW